MCSFFLRRFGEGDQSMSLEEKMFLRFQKEKVKKARNMSLYNLDGDENEAVLTHKGAALGASNMPYDNGWSGSDEEDDNKLSREVVDNLHFGGGFIPKSSSTEANSHDDKHKSKSEILQEIVMKSKLHKMERREAKDAQESQREDLDKQFDSLIAASDVQINKNGKYGSSDSTRDGKGKEKDEFADYDELFGAMQYDTKAQATDRTKTAEEIALEARKKLEKLESDRVKRMNASSGLDDDIGADLSVLPNSKKRRTNDDEIEEFGDNYGWNNRDDKGSDMEPSENDDDSASLEDSEDDLDESEQDLEESVDEEDASENEDDGDSYGSSQDDSEAEAEFDNYLQDLLKKKAAQEGLDSTADTNPKQETLKTKGKGKAASVEMKREEVQISPSDLNGINDKMPHSIDCPTDISKFEELVEKYVVNPAKDFQELVHRIMVWNSIHLPGHQGTTNKPRMHNFMDILVKYFINMGNGLKRDEPSTSQFSMTEVFS